MLREFCPPLKTSDISAIITPRLILRCIPLDETRPLYREWVNTLEHGLLHFSIELSHTKERLGNAGVIAWDSRDRRCEIGYCLDDAYWGRGYMTEAIRAMTHYLLFDIGFNRIEARHAPENPASGAVLRKAGMIYEGCARQRRLKNDVYADRLMYSILFEDLFPKPNAVDLNDFGILTDGDIDVVCDRIIEKPVETGGVSSYECQILLHGTKDKLGSLRLSVGFSDILYYGGHIGYKIEPAHRGHHYAAKACALIKPIANAHGISPVIITCNPDNIPSIKTIAHIGASCVRAVSVPLEFSKYMQWDSKKLIFEWR